MKTLSPSQRYILLKRFISTGLCSAFILSAGTGCLSSSSSGTLSPIGSTSGTASDSTSGTTDTTGNSDSTDNEEMVSDETASDEEEASDSVGPPASIAVSAGNSQSGSVGAALATPLSVVVKDASNQVVSGVTVTWSVTSGPATLGSATSVTNATGIATNTATLGANPGAVSIGASVQGAPSIATAFTAQATTTICGAVNPATPLALGIYPDRVCLERSSGGDATAFQNLCDAGAGTVANGTSCAAWAAANVVTLHAETCNGPTSPTENSWQRSFYKSDVNTALVGWECTASFLGTWE